MATTSAAVGLSRGSGKLSPSSGGEVPVAFQETATAISGGAVPTQNAAWDDQSSTESEQDRLIDEIGRMVHRENKHEETSIGDTSEDTQRQGEIPRNTKKRMYEAEPVRDEL